MNTLRLTKGTASNDVWYAEHRGPHAREALELFGTHVLPTPWSVTRPASEVITDLERLNPGVGVYCG